MLPLQEARVQSLVRELRSHMPRGQKRKRKKIENLQWELRRGQRGHSQFEERPQRRGTSKLDLESGSDLEMWHFRQGRLSHEKRGVIRLGISMKKNKV